MRKCSIALAVNLSWIIFLWLSLTSQASAETDAEIMPHAGKKDTTTIILTGDLLLDRGVRRRIEAQQAIAKEINPNSHSKPDFLFSQGVDSVFCHADIVVANLECPATNIEEPVFKRFIFRADPQWLTTLRCHGITHLNLANNHSIDQGRDGLTDTYKNIKQAGMVPVGAGATMKEACQPTLLASSPRNIWLVTSLRMPLENYMYLPDKPSVSQEDFEALLDRIRNLRQSQPKSYIIVSLHWGWEHKLTPPPDQRQDARRLVDAGADILVCHHTHTMQTIEEYNGHLIYYNIGNFIFDQTKNINTQACMVELKVTQERCSVKTLPIKIINCVPHLIHDNQPAIF